MPIQASCPNCKQSYNVPDTMAGKSVRCKQCATVFPLAGPAPAPKPASPGASPFTFDEPAAMIQSQARAVPPVSPPGQTKRPSKADPQAPAGPPVEAQKSSSALPIILGLCGGAFVLLLVCGGIGVGGYLYVANKAKKAASEFREVGMTLNDLDELAKQMDKAADTQPPAVSDTKPPAGDSTKPGVSKANFDKIKNGMSESEVTAILGPPTDSIAAPQLNIPNMPKNLPKVKQMIWSDGGKAYTVQIMDGKVMAKLSSDGVASLPPDLPNPGDLKVPDIVNPKDKPKLTPEEQLALDIKDMKGEDVNRRRQAVDRVSRASPDSPRRKEVVQTLNDLLKDRDNGIQWSALRALAKWGGKEEVPMFVTLASDPDAHHLTSAQNGKRKIAMTALARLKDERGAEAVAPFLQDFFDNGEAYKSLQEMGPVAEKAVAKFYHHPDGRVRGQARQLLQAYGTKPDVIFNQSVADLKHKDAAFRHASATWLLDAKVDPERRAEVMKGLEPLLLDANGGVCEAAAKAMATWGDKTYATSFIAALDTDNERVREVVLDVMSKYKDERAAEPMAKVLLKDRGRASKALAAFGAPAEKAVVKYMNYRDRGVADEARKLLKQYETKDTLMIAQCMTDLKSVEKDTRFLAASWLGDTKADADSRKDVALALDPLLNDGDGNIVGAAMKALKVWGTKDNVTSLIRMLDSQNGGQRSQAMDALAVIQDERGAEAVAQRLPNFFDNGFASKTLQAMGPVAETAVIPYLQQKEKRARVGACRILNAIGTKKSLPALQVAARDKDKDVALAAANAAKAIASRPAAKP